MLMAAAATHMAGSAHSSSSSSISPPPPPSWHPVVLVPNHNHHHHQHQVLYDHGLATPSPTTPTPQRLRPASRRAGKRRPPRKLPTTYISADAASFRRMVHQVTGADDVVRQATAELLCRSAPAPPSRAAQTTTATLLPTLDTSAFLLGDAQGWDSGRAPSARRGASCRHGSAVAVVGPGAALQAEEEACGSGGVRGGGEHSCSNGGSAGGGGFPSLESWDA